MEYLGNNIIKVRMGHEVVAMNAYELDNIVIDARKVNSKLSTRDKLFSFDETLEEKIKLLEEELSDWKFEYKKIYDDMKQVLKGEVS